MASLHKHCLKNATSEAIASLHKYRLKKHDLGSPLRMASLHNIVEDMCIGGINVDAALLEVELID